MRAYVFNDAALAKHAGRFVWLSIDTEKERNADFLARYPIEVWPTLLVIDPEEERAVLRWPGSATVPQLERLLTDAERALSGGGVSLAEDRPARERERLARADRIAAGTRETAEVIAAYREALAAASRDDQDSRRPRIVESLVIAYLMAHEEEPCAKTAMTEAPSLPRGPSFANVAATGLVCAVGADKAAPWRAEAVGKLEPLATEALALAGILADDRSGLYEALVEAREAAGDTAGTKALALRWLEFLEGEAARARTPEARAAFDPHRVLAAMKAGDPARAIPALVQSEKDLPDDYNAPARLALVYRELGRVDEAIAACDRALAHAYGPRRLRVLETKAKILDGKGDKAGARAVLEEGLRVAEALPRVQNRDALVSRMKGLLGK